MLEWATVERAVIADGGDFVLARHGDDWVVRVDHRILMTNRVHDSEIALAEHAISKADSAGTVLVGGLGLGYTLRAVLDRVPAETEVTVVELVPELVDWNRRHLGELNAQPLDDVRVSVVVADVFDVIKRAQGSYDVILLDVDNGPRALAQPKNQRLYGDHGVRACYAALKPGGILAVWSAGVSAWYERKLRKYGLEVEVLRVPARVGARGKHVLFLGKRRE